LLAEDGYLLHVTERLKALYGPADGSPAEYDQQIKTAEDDAQALLGRRINCLHELRTAVKSVGTAILGARTFTVNEMVKRIREAEDQYLKAKAEACLLQEAKKVARSVCDFVLERKRDLQKFSQALGGFAEGCHTKSKEFLNFRKEVLFIRLFDKEKDWPHFYKLGLDEIGQPAAVDAKKEYRSFLDQTVGPQSSLLELVALFTKAGEQEFRKCLNS
jgi:hypothetical protein